MSHSTGILPGHELNQFIKKVKTSGKCRVMKILISNEQLVLEEHKEPSGKWEADYAKYVAALVIDRQPCYLLFRMDTKNDTSNIYDWLLIVWSPEGSPVREKMLFASTKASLKKEFGSSNIILDYFASTTEEISLPSFKLFMERKRKEENGEHDEALLTMQEQELRIIKQEEANLSTQNAKPTKTLPGVVFPLTEDSVAAIQDMKDGLVSYVQLSIDVKSEVIQLEKRELHKDFELKDLPSKASTTSPRYHLILFAHNHDSLFHKSIVFVYSVPGSSSTVKERMLYSSCKNALLTHIIDQIGLAVHKKLECDDVTEITAEYLILELHPNKESGVKPQFEKPKGPTGKRGLRRLIKSSDD